MNIEEFLNKHDLYGSDPWIGYCEIIINESGNIYEAVPSHSEWLIRYAMKQFKTTRNQIYKRLIPIYADPVCYFVEKFHLTSCWYDQIITYPGFEDNDALIQTLMKLYSSQVFSTNPISMARISHEYSVCEQRR